MSALAENVDLEQGQHRSALTPGDIFENTLLRPVDLHAWNHRLYVFPRSQAEWYGNAWMQAEYVQHNNVTDQSCDRWRRRHSVGLRQAEYQLFNGGMVPISIPSVIQDTEQMA